MGMISHCHFKRPYYSTSFFVVLHVFLSENAHHSWSGTTYRSVFFLFENVSRETFFTILQALVVIKEFSARDIVFYKTLFLVRKGMFHVKQMILISIYRELFK